MIEDELIIGTYFYGGPEKAIDIAKYMKSFLEYLETVSPWKRPFFVSGDKRSTADMPVHEDCSNFYDQLFVAWKANNGKVYSDSEGNRKLKFFELYTSPLGFSGSFGNAVTNSNYKEQVSISFSMGHQFRKNIVGRNLHNTLLIHIRKFKEGEQNSNWANRDVVATIMKRLISDLAPYETSVFSSKNVVGEIDGVRLPHKFNWLTYIADNNICSLLKNSEFAREYENGLWIELGRNVDTVFNSNARKEAEDIGRIILKANN